MLDMEAAAKQAKPLNPVAGLNQDLEAPGSSAISPTKRSGMPCVSQLKLGLLISRPVGLLTGAREPFIQSCRYIQTVVAWYAYGQHLRGEGLVSRQWHDLVTQYSILGGPKPYLCPIVWLQSTLRELRAHWQCKHGILPRAFRQPQLSALPVLS